MKKIKVTHYRLPASEGYKKKGMPDIKKLKPYVRGDGSFMPHPTGGATVVKIYENGYTYTGITLCSMSENYKYRRGFDKAYLRALMIQRLEGPLTTEVIPF